MDFFFLFPEVGIERTHPVHIVAGYDAERSAQPDRFHPVSYTHLEKKKKSDYFIVVAAIAGRVSKL